MKYINNNIFKYSVAMSVVLCIMILIGSSVIMITAKSTTLITDNKSIQIPTHNALLQSDEFNIQYPAIYHRSTDPITTIQNINQQILDKKKETSKEVIQDTAEILKLHEGFRSTVYRCSSGQRTIGYGTAVKPGQTKISKEKANKLLINEVKKNAAQLDEHLPWWKDLSKERKMALLNLTYNMGINKVLKFKKMLAALEQADYEIAAKQLLKGTHGGKSKYYTQVGKRAVQVANALVTNEWDIDNIKRIYA